MGQSCPNHSHSLIFAKSREFNREIRRFVQINRVSPEGHLSTRQYARLVDEWVTAIGLRSEEYGTHSLRRTKAALIYKATGNLQATQILVGHTKIENTVRYLGVDIDDALTLADDRNLNVVSIAAQLGFLRGRVLECALISDTEPSFANC